MKRFPLQIKPGLIIKSLQEYKRLCSQVISETVNRCNFWNDYLRKHDCMEEELCLIVSFYKRWQHWPKLLSWVPSSSTPTIQQIFILSTVQGKSRLAWLKWKYLIYGLFMHSFHDWLKYLFQGCINLMIVISHIIRSKLMLLHQGPVQSEQWIPLNKANPR